MLQALFLAGALCVSASEKPPEPAIAVGLSVGIGFGAGHFYAQKPGLGMLFLVSDAALLGIPYFAEKRMTEDGTWDEDAAKIAVGLAFTYSIVRAAEIVSSPIVAVNQVALMTPKPASRAVEPMPTEWTGGISPSRETVGMIYSQLGKNPDRDFEKSVHMVQEMLADGTAPSIIVKQTVDYLVSHPDMTVPEALMLIDVAQ